jgi:N-acetylglucosaminyldiphosphoundecaprenol N-acetyl-beta-D-mannosaminyltransferase
MHMQADNRSNVLGVPIDPFTMNAMLERAQQVIEQRGQLLIGVVNAAKLVKMNQQEKLREAVMSADVILADGMGAVWGAWFLGKPLPERVPGIDLMEHLLELASQRQHSVFCLGATQEILNQVLEKIADRYPGARIAGSHHGYFGPDDEQGIADQIRESGADMLFAAMSSPKKEEFLARWSTEIKVPICHGVGGAFDVMAGKVQRAPKLWQRLGFEWLYRVLQEPGRLWKRYLVTNTQFGWMLLKQRFSARNSANNQPNRS